ncbi:hypothetical protein JCM3770_006812 [Rhodotorula araucariae]
MSDSDPAATLGTLKSSLSALEAALAPLVAKPLDLHLEGQDPLVQARAQVLASYVVHDLVWVYLKTAGVDPAAHPVMQEIERLKTYFGKLKGAERGLPATADTPARPRMQVDRNAASRFINAAIASQRAQVDPAYTSVEGEDAEAGPSGTHTRFSEDEDENEADAAEALGGAEVDRLLEDKPEDEDETPLPEGDAMEVEPLEVTEQPSAGTPEKGKGKEGVKGKKRKSLDPFAGYDQPKSSTPRTAATSKAKTPKSAESKRTRASAAAGAGADASSGSGASTPTAAASAEGMSKNARKKLRMKQGAK